MSVAGRSAAARWRRTGSRRRAALRLVAAGAAVLALAAGCSGGGADGSAEASSPGTASTASAFVDSGFAACPAATGPASGALAEVAALPCMDGSGAKVALGAPTGRPVVLNFWGSWCPPCGEELPAFVRLANRAGDRLAVVGVNTSDDAARAVAAAGELDVTFANVFDHDAAVRKALRINTLPATAFVSPSGEVVHVYRGTPLTDDTLGALVRRYLGVTVE